MGIAGAFEIELSKEQAAFAREHEASAGLEGAGSEGAVFMYHDEPRATYRWLVDAAGRVVDATTFRRSPARRSRAAS